MDFCDEYLLSKSTSRPQKLVRNASAHLSMAHLKTEYTLIKTVHCFDDEQEKKETDNYEDQFEIDLQILQFYSMNKRKRWELELGQDVLDRCREMHKKEDVNVVLLERVNLKTFEWKYISWARNPTDFLINTLHYCDQAGAYRTIRLNSIFGQKFSHFETRNIGERAKTIVAYNFIRAPKNYVVLGERNFVASNYGGRYPYYAHKKRVAQWKEDQFYIKKFMKNERKQEESEIDDEKFEEFEENFEKEHDGFSKFYNLEDHFIEKSDFVIVKKRRKSWRSCT